jgi:hypothetical protein
MKGNQGRMMEALKRRPAAQLRAESLAEKPGWEPAMGAGGGYYRRIWPAAPAGIGSELGSILRGDGTDFALREGSQGGDARES